MKESCLLQNLHQKNICDSSCVLLNAFFQSSALFFRYVFDGNESFSHSEELPTHCGKTKEMLQIQGDDDRLLHCRGKERLKM